MKRATPSFVFAGLVPAELVLALACARKLEPTPAPPVTAAVVESACDPISLQEAAELTVAVMHEHDWMVEPEAPAWFDPYPQIELNFEQQSRHVWMKLDIPSSPEQVEAALAIPNSPGRDTIEPLPDDQIAGIGERAEGRIQTRTYYEDHVRGTRKRSMTFVLLNFVRCGVVVQVAALNLPYEPIRLARELDKRLAAQTCCPRVGGRS